MRQSMQLRVLEACLVVLLASLLGFFVTKSSFADTNQQKMGDLDSSGKVDAADMSILLSNLNKNTSIGDIDGSGKVDVRDLSILISNLGKTTTTGTTTPVNKCPTSNDILFCDNFESYPKVNIPAGDLTDPPFADNWMLNQSCPDRVSIADDPVRSGQKALKLTVKNTDFNANCPKSPNANPRAQMVTNKDKVKFEYGKEYFISFGTYFPTDFPRNIAEKSDGTRQGYFQIGQIWGGPVTCSPPIAIFLQGTKLRLNQEIGKPNACNVLGNQWLAEKDVQYGKWEKITLHVKMSKNVDEGYVELWYNGEPQKFKESTPQKPVYRHQMATMIDGVNWDSKKGSTNNLYMNSYRGAQTENAVGFLTIYHDDVKIGKTYESVQ